MPRTPLHAHNPDYWSHKAETAMELFDLLTDQQAKRVLLDLVVTCADLAQRTKREAAPD